MFARSIAFLSLVVLAVATPNAQYAKRWGSPPPTTTTTTVVVTATPTPTGSTCSTGPIQCCDSTETTSNPDTSFLFPILDPLGVLEVVIKDVGVAVGLGCSPVDVGVGGGSCDSTTVCCEDNSFGALIAIGCVPITVL